MRNRPQPAKTSPGYFFECGRCRRPQLVDPQHAGSKMACPCGVTNVVPSILHLQKLSTESCPAFAPVPTRPRSGTPQCPFCAQPMQPGRILGDRYQLKWLDANAQPMLGIFAVGGIPIGRGGFLQFNRPHVWGWRCVGCAKIIVDERA